MPRVLALGLILLLILLSLPILVSMGLMESCPACPATAMMGALGLCLAVISLFAIVLLSTSTALQPRPILPRLLLLASGIERPPKSS
jgi:hypothetical protein